MPQVELKQTAQSLSSDIEHVVILNKWPSLTSCCDLENKEAMKFLGLCKELILQRKKPVVKKRF